MFPSVESWKRNMKESHRQVTEQVVAVPEQYNDKNFWKEPNPYANISIDDLLDDD